MKKPTKRRKAGKVKEAEVQQSVMSPPTAAPEGPPGILEQGPDGEYTIRPFPEDLLRAAEEEPDHRDLAEYRDVINTLRRKGFSFRDIAQWLSERNVAADRRVYIVA